MRFWVEYGNWMKASAYIVLLILLISVLGCKRDSAEDIGIDGSGWQAPQGTYEGPCLIDGDAIIHQFAKIVYEFNSPNVSFAINAYDNSDTCDPAAQYLSQKTEYTFFEPTETKNLIKLSAQDSTLTLFKSNDADWANAVTYCGYSDWKVDVPVILSGKTCKNGPKFVQVGTERYLSVILEGDTIIVDSIVYQRPK